jgi:hypothetical protein
MENSKIEWRTHTSSPWIGCQEFSPGCGGGENGALCYAKTLIGGVARAATRRQRVSYRRATGRYVLTFEVYRP